MHTSYPLEYFSTQIAFAGKIAAITGADLLDSLSTYTDVYGELTGIERQAEPNQANVAAFTHRLQSAATLDEAIDAFPHQVLGAVGPIQEFYDHYAIRV
jgi:hypothetical protein